MEIIIGIGEYAVSRNPKDTIKTFALGSCVAVVAYCPRQRTGGMIHLALPETSSVQSRESRPGYYVTSGVPLLINEISTLLPCRKDELKISIYGGADSARPDDIFEIGKRNIVAVTSALAALNLTAEQANIGGRFSRTVELDVATGKVNVITQPLNI